MKTQITKLVQAQAKLAEAANLLREVSEYPLTTKAVADVAKQYEARVRAILTTAEQTGLQDLLNLLRAGGAQ